MEPSKPVQACNGIALPLPYFYFLTADGCVGTENMAKKSIILLCSINWFLVDNGKCHLQY
jgi:hypothetical protein